MGIGQEGIEGRPYLEEFKDIFELGRDQQRCGFSSLALRH